MADLGASERGLTLGHLDGAHVLCALVQLRLQPPRLQSHRNTNGTHKVGGEITRTRPGGHRKDGDAMQRRNDVPPCARACIGLRCAPCHHARRCRPTQPKELASSSRCEITSSHNRPQPRALHLAPAIFARAQLWRCRTWRWNMSFSISMPATLSERIGSPSGERIPAGGKQELVRRTQVPPGYSIKRALCDADATQQRSSSRLVPHLRGSGTSRTLKRRRNPLQRSA